MRRPNLPTTTRKTLEQLLALLARWLPDERKERQGGWPDLATENHGGGLGFTADLAGIGQVGAARSFAGILALKSGH